MIYADDPDNPGKRVSVLELQRRNPFDHLPPVLINEWMKHELWSLREALYLLAGCLPPFEGMMTNIFLNKEYLDGTSDERLHFGAIPPKGYPLTHKYDNEDDLNLTHPLKGEIEGHFGTLQSWTVHCTLADTKSPEEWIEWAASKDFKPYWLDYVDGTKLGIAAKVEAVQASGFKSKAKQQDDEILRIIKEELSLNPLELPRVKKGSAGTKASVRKMLYIPSHLFVSNKVFNTTWERLRNDNKVNEKESG